MARAKIAIGATKWIAGKLMRWSGTAWKASRRKVGGKLAIRQPSSITKSSGGKLVNRSNKIKPSTTANTSKDTIRGSGTRTGQPGPNRKLISASKIKSKPKPTLRSRLSSKWRNFQNQRWLDSRKSSGAINRALKNQPIGPKSFKGGLVETGVYLGAEALLSPVAKWANRKLWNNLLIPAGRKLDDAIPGINSEDERRRIEDREIAAAQIQMDGDNQLAMQEAEGARIAKEFQLKEEARIKALQLKNRSELNTKEVLPTKSNVNNSKVNKLKNDARVLPTSILTQGKSTLKSNRKELNRLLLGR